MLRTSLQKRICFVQSKVCSPLCAKSEQVVLSACTVMQHQKNIQNSIFRTVESAVIFDMLECSTNPRHASAYNSGNKIKNGSTNTEVKGLLPDLLTVRCFAPYPNLNPYQEASTESNGSILFTQENSISNAHAESNCESKIFVCNLL